MNNILVSGYSGFVGSHLLRKLADDANVSLLGRSTPPKCYKYFNATIDSSSDYSAVLNEIDVVIHIAARVHIMDDSAINTLEAYREVNTRGTVNLAHQALKAGVKRFVFVSSIKVNGESTSFGKPFTAADCHLPKDDYALSKSEAELELLRIANNTGMEVVIIRPTLVYGPGVKANFASLMNLISKGIPLPVSCIGNNRRSLVSVTNLVDLIITCIHHPKAANQVFLVSDDNDVSTSQIVREMATALKKPLWQLPVPVWCFQLIGKLFHKEDVVSRLIGSLQVDISHTKQTLAWTPPQTLEDGFKETALAFLHTKRK